MDNCKYCSMKPEFYCYDGVNKAFYQWENAIQMGDGGYTQLYIGVDEHGKMVIFACGDDYTDMYYPKYCPECGRRLDNEVTI